MILRVEMEINIKLTLVLGISCLRISSKFAYPSKY